MLTYRKLINYPESILNVLQFFSLFFTGIFLIEMEKFDLFSAEFPVFWLY